MKKWYGPIFDDVISLFHSKKNKNGDISLVK